MESDLGAINNKKLIKDKKFKKQNDYYYKNDNKSKANISNTVYKNTFFINNKHGNIIILYI